ncbi:MAG: 30S ribosomal protein S21 [Candidatus Pacebacteria bacterium]|nr:30S ribosomal protein S21 [Candidatus Paceibacterota bacterium]
MHVQKKEGETANSLIFRFSKKVMQSGILREARKRRFHDRPISRIKRRLSAIHREVKRKETERNKKLGIS